MQNRNTILAAVGVIALIFTGIGLYVFNSSKAQTAAPQTPSEYEEEILTATPEEIGLEFMAKSDKKYVKFAINNPKDIEYVAYDIIYDAISNGNVVSQGLTGEVKEDEISKDKIEINYRELGTCSTGGKCRFDEGVKKVTLVLKITKTDGKIYQVEKSIDL